jgi:hypothetical protein
VGKPMLYDVMKEHQLYMPVLQPRDPLHVRTDPGPCRQRALGERTQPSGTTLSTY